MRKLSLIAIGLALGSLSACDRAAPPGTSATAEPQPPPEEYDRLELLLGEFNDRVPEFEREVGQLMERLPGRSGELLEALPQHLIPVAPEGYFEQFERGLPLRENWMNCSRYLTNNASAGFCEDEPPDNWRPFMFNDERFFFVPLGPSA
jgi:hypothetical protein